MSSNYFTFARAFRRWAQYCFIRRDTAFFACADICRVRVFALLNDCSVLSPLVAINAP
jgi:hypothetical protein